MNTNQRYLEFGEFRIDTIDHILLCNGQKISLTHKAFQLLLTLVENKGHLLKHKELMDLVWQETAVDQSSLKQNIALLRKALGDTSEEPKYIQTMPKYGYRFIAPVKTLPDENIALIAERHTITQIEIEEEFQSSPKQLKSASSNRTNYWLFSAIILIVLAVFFILSQKFFFTKPKTNIFAVNNIIPNKLTDLGNVERGVISPKGDFVVYNTYTAENGFSLWVRGVENKETLQLVPPSLTERPEAFTISNDGNWVYYVSTKGDWGEYATLYRISILGGKPHKVTEHLDSFISLSPDDKKIAFNRFSEQGCQLIVANALDGSNEEIIAQGKNNGEYIEPKWSPDGKRILFYNIERRTDANYWSLLTISVEDKQIQTVLQPIKQKFWFLAWSADGNILINANDPLTRLPQLYSVSYPDGKMERTTNDLFYYTGVSVGGSSVVSTKKERISDFYVSDSSNSTKKISSGFFDTFELTNDGRIVFASANGAKRHLWLMNPDGTNKEQISPDEFDESLPSISPDNRFITFISNRSGTFEVWISDIDGGHPKQLTSGNSWVWKPKFAPEGNSVYFEMSKNESSILLNISINGGEIREIVTDVSILFYDISPDGKLLAYSFQEKGTNKMKVAIKSLETGKIIRFIDFSPSRFLIFSPDGKSLIYKSGEENAPASSVWTRSIEGENERQLFDFKENEVFWFSYSPDGKRFSFISGKPSSDLILLKSIINSSDD